MPVSTRSKRKPPAKPFTGLAVVGMHRSGTSAAAGVLHHLGIELGDRFLPAQEGVNDQGFWEHVDVVDLHDRALQWAKRDWHDVRGMPSTFFEGEGFAAAVGEARGIIRDSFPNAGLWAIKDPRIALMLPVWRRAVAEEGGVLKCLLTLRDPLEVAGSLSRRDALSTAQSLILWGEHLATAVRDSRGLARSVLEYAALLEDWRAQVRRVADELDLDLEARITGHGRKVDEFLSEGLRRQRSAGRPVNARGLVAKAYDLYDVLRAVSAGTADWDDAEVAADAFREMADLLVPHVHELLQHIYMHDARARQAHELVSHGLDGKAALIGRLADDLASLKDATSQRVQSLDQAFEEARRAFDTTLAEQAVRMQAASRLLDERDAHIIELQKHVSGLESRRTELEAQLLNVQHFLGEARSGFEVALSEREARAVAASEQVRERDRWLGEVRAHAQALEENRLVLEREVVGLQHGLGHANERVARLSEELKAARQEGGQARELLRQREAWVEELQKHVSGLESRRTELEAQLGEVRAHAHALEENRLVLEREMAGLQHGLGHANERVARLSEELTAARGEGRQANERAACLSEELKAAREESGQAQELLHQRASWIEELQRHVEGLEARGRQLEAQLGDSERALVASRAVADELFDTRVLAQGYAETLRHVAASRSWRLTTPLRWIASNARRWLGRGQAKLTYQQAKGIASVSPASIAASVPPAAAAASPGPPAVLAPAQPAPAGDAELAVLRRTIYGADASGRAPEYVADVDVEPPAAADLRAKVIAYYLPQFHPIPENDEWWGRGFTEWTNVTKAQPQFDGHYQPHLPGELGFYDLRMEQAIERQVELARQYGIHGFCFHYYWFAGRRLLREPLDVFMRSDIEFPFCLCWANENWTRRWDGQDSEILIGQEHGPENDLAFIRDLEPCLRDPRYIRIDGRPLVVVYRPSILPDAAATLLRWREYCREAGIGEIFLAMVQFDCEDPRTYGFDVALEFPPHKLAAGLPAINHQLDMLNPEYAGHVVHYQALVDVAKAWPLPDYPMIRAVFPGWDNEARRPGRGYTFAFSSPARYKDWLEGAVAHAERHPVAGERVVMVNAWNEWAEGAHLEPDRRYGRAYLQATREVIERGRGNGALTADAPVSQPRRIVFVSHDAHPHGAQYLALHIVRELVDAFGFEVHLVLLGDGELKPEFEAVAQVHMATGLSRSPEALAGLAGRFAGLGIEAAIVNTTVSGHCAAAFSRAGLRVVCLVHELPELIRSYGLELEAESIARHADHVVFAAPQVRDGFVGFAQPDAERVVLRPQGLFVRSRYIGGFERDLARIALRKRLRIPADARVVLAVGYGDARKGVDTFCEVASRVRRQRDDVHFVWVGHYDRELVDAARRNWGSDGLHFVGKEFETDDFYAGADLYALTSREDPFPSVLMESLSVATPVVAFAGSGGADELLPRCGGFLVDSMDGEAFSRELLRLLKDDALRAEVGSAGAELVAREFNFRRYVFDLLGLAGFALPRVTAVVPNYNYAALLPERLASVLDQTLPPYEVIVLDDASSDNSLQVLSRLRHDASSDFLVVPSQCNSGSVFRQWHRGALLARGDYLWIAEADDLSDRNFLETVAGLMVPNPEVVLGYCESRQIDQKGAQLANDYRYYTDAAGSGRWARDYVCPAREEVEAGLGIRNTIPNVSAVVFRTEAFREAIDRNLDEIAGLRVAGDWLTYAHVLVGGSLAYSAKSLNVHRRHDGSVTSRLNAEAHVAEVARVQDVIGRMFDSSQQVRRGMAAYRAQLRAHFGLLPPEPVPES